MRWGVLVLAGACGRIGFDPAGGGTTGADGPLDTNGPNYMFVTSAQVIPASLGGLGGADAFCTDAAASVAKLSGRYVAWLSTTGINAVDRLGSARGWQRVDGLPFADTALDISAGRIFYPPDIDETGNKLVAEVPTGTDGSGQATASTCGDWTDSQSTATFGLSNATAFTFSFELGFNTGCAAPDSIYCFGVEHDVPVSLPAATAGKLLFVASPWTVGAGVTDADQHCTQEANAAAHPGTFRAILATSTTTAASRITGVTGPIVRVDGLRVAASVADLVADVLETSPNLALDGSPIAADVYAGADSPTVLACAGCTCQDWTDPAFVLPATAGRSALGGKGWFGVNVTNRYPRADCGAQPIYCLEL